MLSPKRSQIEAAAGTFGQEEIDLWFPILVGSRVYKRNPEFFSDLESKLAGVVADTTQAKQLNATMTLIDRIGPTDASVDGAEIYSTLDNREGLIEYVLSALYGAAYRPRFTLSGGTSVRTHPVW